jgi:hypothetical protein
MIRLLLLAIASLLALGASGCAPQGIEIVPVTGVVKLDGAPVKAASVMLTPLDPERMPAMAVTDDEGKFELKTNSGKDLGVMVGKYDVMVIGVRDEGVAVNEDGTSGDMSKYRQVWFVPKKYSKRDSSGLDATVVKNMPPLELNLSTK